MFQVRHKQTGKIRTVYGLNGTHYLLWDKEIGWFYEDISAYRPSEVMA